MTESNTLNFDGTPIGLDRFDQAYTGVPPWEIGRPQPPMREVVDAGRVTGRVLDAGCGTGELALLAASRGLDATGVDASPRAIAIARARAEERGLSGVRFEVGDVLDLGWLGTEFDTVVDSGLFHVFTDEDRARWMDSLRAVLVDGGRYILVCFSDAQPGDWGPRRVTRAELETVLGDGFELESIDPVTMDVNLEGGVVQAWRASAVRRA